MKVSFDDMTDRERIVLTKEQLLHFVESCTPELLGHLDGGFTIHIDTPPIIEVEEVMGE